MIARRNAAALALLTFSLSGLLLTGCAAGAAASDSKATAEATAAAPAAAQTVEEACGLMEAALTEVPTAMNESMTTFLSDPAAGIAGLQTFAGEFEAVRSEVDAPEVKAEADAAGVALDEMIAALEAGVADPASFDLEALAVTAQTVKDGFVAIGEVCGG